jgi:hypothetical protein
MTDRDENSAEMLATPTSHVAFLSSLSHGLRKFRRDLHEECGGQLWVAEVNRSDLKTKHPLEIVDVCIEALKQSEVFICVLGGSVRATRTGGTAIELDGLETRVSYFEIEVFQAALSQIPVVLLQRSDFSPGRRMEAFLRVLERCSVVTRRISGLPANDHARIRKEVRDVIADRAELRRKASRRLHAAAGDLATRLVSERAKLQNVRDGGTDMLWMHGDTISEPAGDQATLSRAATLLKVASAEKRHDKRLSRLYIAFRELMTVPYQNTFEPDILSAWNSGFGLWCGSAAWYGLHNHVALGVIGGLWSQHVVRKRLAQQSKTNSLGLELRPPFGALASAYLSLSKMCCNQLWRSRVSKAGIRLATQVIDAGADDDPGIYAVRGSLFFVQLSPWRAMSDFHELLARARKQPSNIGLNAEAHTYIGRGYALTHRRVKAREHLTEAVRLWEEHVREKHVGEEFLVKAMKHLIAFQIQTKQFEDASVTAGNALRIARASGVYDQVRQIEEILKSRSEVRPPR